MAISNNPLMHGVTGSINKQIVLRRYGNKTVVSAYPDMSNRKLSDRQKRMNELMKEANESAKTIMKDEEQCNAARLRLDVPRNKLYTALIKEYFAKVSKNAIL
jgi:hypothetical protein